MSELASLLRKLKVEAVSNDAYIYYEKETGSVKKVSNRKYDSDEYEVLIVTQDEAKPLLQGEFRLDEYIIAYDVSLKDRKLKRKTYEDQNKIAFAAVITANQTLLHNFKNGDLGARQEVPVQLSGAWRVQSFQKCPNALRLLDCTYTNKYFASVPAL